MPALLLRQKLVVMVAYKLPGHWTQSSSGGVAER